MLRNFILANLRFLRKNKFHSFINIAGLTLGITCTVVVYSIERFEYSFDTYHPEPQKTYRVVVTYGANNDQSYSAGLPYPLSDRMRQDFAEVKYSTIIDFDSSDPVINVVHEDGTRNLFKESQSVFVDNDYFKIFRYDFIEGNAQSALSTEKSVVLSASVAQKYFGEAPALNQIISYNGKYDLKVTGVVKDPPLNTDLPFSVLISTNLGADKHSRDTWNYSSGGINCYVVLQSNVNSNALQDKMKTWHLKYFNNVNEDNGRSRAYLLQPLREVHFDQRFLNFNKTISGESLFALALIGGLLLLTACINFINLNTVLIVNRAREVGVRKVMGSGKFPLVIQFLGETFIVSTISLVCSLGTVPLVLQYLEPILGYHLRFSLFTDSTLVVFIALIPFVVTLLAGLYPALSLSSFQPIHALKSKIVSAAGGVSFRRTLIGLQLIVSQGLVICTIIIVQQIEFFNNQPLGLNSKSVVEFDIPDHQRDFRIFKERIQNIPGVQLVTASNTGGAAMNAWTGGFEAKVGNEIVKGDAQVKFVDADYLKTYEMSLQTGEDLVDSDSANMFLVNEAFVRALGIQRVEDAIGVPVTYWGSKKAIIRGVVKNFHSNSLHAAIAPVIIMTDPEFYTKMTVRFDALQEKQVMTSIEKEWKSAFPEAVFQYGFLEDLIHDFYDEERRTSKLITIFALIAIAIGSIGLLGLVSFTVTKKTKEVGIRKTLGADILSIMMLFVREFIILIIVTFIVAAPVTSIVMREWLSKFAFHITPGVLTFAVGALISLVVVLLTVGFIAFRAASANPVKALRNE